MDELHPDWLPTQYLGKLRHAHMPSAGSVERYERLRRRQELKVQEDESSTESDGNIEDEHGVETEKMHQSTTSTEVLGTISYSFNRS